MNVKQICRRSACGYPLTNSFQEVVVSRNVTVWFVLRRATIARAQYLDSTCSYTCTKRCCVLHPRVADRCQTPQCAPFCIPEAFSSFQSKRLTSIPSRNKIEHGDSRVEILLKSGDTNTDDIFDFFFFYISLDGWNERNVLFNGVRAYVRTMCEEEQFGATREREIQLKHLLPELISRD